MNEQRPNAGTEVAWQALRDVQGQELCIDVVSLRHNCDVLVYETGLDVDMTLTTSGCPVSEHLPGEAAEAPDASPQPGTRQHGVGAVMDSRTHVDEAPATLGLHPA
jgi:metal-sulfur cluster biosynthetic enzyme